MRFDDLSGQELNGVEVIEHVEARRTGTRTVTHYWRCRCRCGKLFVTARNNLVRPHTTSCGCVSSAKTTDRNTKHGHNVRGRRSAEYSTWASLRQRCTNEASPDYPDYGGRGIRVCRRWAGKNGFVSFLSDMGARPSGKHSVERIDTHGDYTPTNCKWATAKEQARNTRRNRLLTLDGRTLCVAAWAEELGISPATLHYRLRVWTLRRALTTAKTTKVPS